MMLSGRIVRVILGLVLAITVVPGCHTKVAVQPGPESLAGSGPGPAIVLAAGQSFQYPSCHDTAEDVVSADFNEDGQMDIAWSSAWWPVTRVLFGGERGFAGETTGFRAADAGRCGALAATDIDLDGHKEILVAVSDNLITLKGTGNGRFQVGATHFLGVYPRAIITAELNDDGCPDVAAVGAAAGGEYLAVLLNDGQGSLRTPVQYPTGEYAGDLASADFDLDGHADLAVTCSQTSAPTPRGPDMVMVFRNNGSGLFKAGPSLDGLTRPTSVVASDFNGDGYADLAVAEFLNGALQILEGAGDGTFLPMKEYPLPEALYPRLAVADFTRDGKLDAAVICPTRIAPSAFEGAVSTVEIFVNQTDYTPD